MKGFYNMLSWDNETVDFGLNVGREGTIITSVNDKYSSFEIDVLVDDFRLLDDLCGLYFDDSTRTLGLIDFKTGKTVWATRVGRKLDSYFIGLKKDKYVILRAKDRKTILVYDIRNGEFVGAIDKQRHLLNEGELYTLSESRNKYTIKTNKVECSFKLTEAIILFKELKQFVILIESSGKLIIFDLLQHKVVHEASPPKGATFSKVHINRENNLLVTLHYFDKPTEMWVLKYDNTFTLIKESHIPCSGRYEFICDGRSLYYASRRIFDTHTGLEQK